MKKINLISETELFQSRHFYVANYYGKETVVFRVSEQEFINKSLYFSAYSADFKPIPYDTPTCPNGLNVRDFYCGIDFYIIAFKGTIGFDEMIYVSKCHVEETEDEFVIKITLETEEETKSRLLEVHSKNDTTISFFFHDNYFSKINEYSTPVPELVKKADETPFLDVDENIIIQLTICNSGEYKFAADTKGYTVINPTDSIEVGTLLYGHFMKNSVEIAKIKQIAHSVYGYFYAVIEPVYVFPRDAEEIKKEYPIFFKEHCISNAERTVKEFIGKPETVSFISKSTEIGEPVIYQPLNTSNGYPGITSDIFQFMVSGSKGFADYEQSDEAFIRVGTGAIVGTLIQVDGRYKILLYKCEGVVKNKNKNYVKFKYEDHSEFFDDFSNASKNLFKKYHHRMLIRNLEFLLCREKITPVVISKEKYDTFAINQ